MGHAHGILVCDRATKPTLSHFATVMPSCAGTRSLCWVWARWMARRSARAVPSGGLTARLTRATDLARRPGWCLRTRRSSGLCRGRSAPRSTAATNTRRASVASPRTLSTRSAASQSGSAQQRYRIRFQGERVVEAQDIRDALHQAELLGAIEITAVARED
jgi:hypothetical protein